MYDVLLDIFYLLDAFGGNLYLPPTTTPYQKL